MILVVAAVLVFVTVPLTGGSLRRLAELRFVAQRWLAAGVALQVVVLGLLASVLPHALAAALHVATYAFVGWFVIANRRTRGVITIALGGAANLIAIAANGGVMPARPAALRSAGLVVDAGQFANSNAVAHPRLWFLGDIWSIPDGWPFANVFSIGDIVLVVGVGVLVHVQCHTRIGRRLGGKAAAPATMPPALQGASSPHRLVA